MPSPSEIEKGEPLPDVLSNLPSAVTSLVERMAREPKVRRVILFGSRARGDHGQRSDVDLALEVPGGDSGDWLTLQGLAEDAETLLPIDLVWLDEATEAMRDEVRQEGLVLFERPAEAV